ncbi:MAG: sulfatase family protein [Oceanipulchritudo sp.]
MPEQPANILIIHCHDLGQHLGCYGIDTVRSPHIDRFAREGILFRRAFATAPQCSPSRASMYTGTYPEQNGVMGLCSPIMGWDLNPDVRHLGQILSAADYFTFGCGIIHETHSGPQRCGLQAYDNEEAVAKMPESFARQLSIAKQDGRPFYGQVGFFAPHRRPIDWRNKKEDQGFLEAGMEPDTAKGVQVPGYLTDTTGTRDELAELQAAIHGVDHAFGEMLRTLEQAGLRENTILVLTTDHGIAMPRAKCSLYDPGIEIAMLLQWPEKLTKARTIDALYSNIDLTPTLLELAGLRALPRMSGLSWAPVLLHEAKPARGEIFASMTFHDYYFPMRAIRTDRHKLIVHFSNTHAFMDPTQSWHHRSSTITPPNNNRSQSPLVELYDLEADPWEQHNLAEDADYSAIKRDLLQRLARHMREVGDPLPKQGFPSPRHVQACELLEFN